MLFSGAIASNGDAQARRYALLIGVDEYPADPGIKALSFAEKDAADLHNILEDQEDYGAKVLLGREATRRWILTEFYRLARIVKPEDTFLLYFAGHGVRDSNGQTYWLTPYADLDLLEEQGIRLSHLMDYVRDIKAKNKVVLLDHCFSGDIAKTILAADGSRSSGGPDDQSMVTSSSRVRAARLIAEDSQLLESQIGEGSMWVIASALNYAYEDAAAKQGVFTKGIIEALTTKKADKAPRDNKVSVRELSDFLDEYMTTVVAPKQRIKAIHRGSPTDFVVSGRRTQDHAYYDDIFLRLVNEGLIDKAGSYYLKIVTVMSNWALANNANVELDQQTKDDVDKVKLAIDANDDDRLRATDLKLAFVD